MKSPQVIIVSAMFFICVAATGYSQEWTSRNDVRLALAFELAQAYDPGYSSYSEMPCLNLRISATVPITKNELIAPGDWGIRACYSGWSTHVSSVGLGVNWWPTESGYMEGGIGYFLNKEFDFHESYPVNDANELRNLSLWAGAGFGNGWVLFEMRGELALAKNERRLKKGFNDIVAPIKSGSFWWIGISVGFQFPVFLFAKEMVS